MAATIKDIAQILHISPSTVSLALRHSPRIKASTRERIEEVAKKLSYCPCPQAVELQAGKSNLIGYLLTYINESFFHLIMKGLNRQATRHGYGVILALASDLEEQTEQLDFLFRKRIDGLVISGTQEGTLGKILVEAERQHVSVVSTQAEFFDELPISSVCVDNRKGEAMGADYLLSLGHRDILWASCSRELASRYLGAVEACQMVSDARLRKAIGEEEIKAVMSEASHPTAILAYSDYDAVVISRYLKELGLRIPQDVSLMGFDGIDTLAMKEFDFTTIVQPQEQIGEVAFDLLMKSMTNGAVERVGLEPTLLIGKTTRKIQL